MSNKTIQENIKTLSDFISKLLNNLNLETGELFRKMVEDDEYDPSIQGWYYEALCKVLIISKCISGIDYKNVKSGYTSSIINFENFESIIETNIHSGNNRADIILEDSKNTIIGISIKHGNSLSVDKTDVALLDKELENKHIKNFKVGLIVKDKNSIKKHSYRNSNNASKTAHDKVIKNNLLFDVTDIKIGLNVFKEKFNKEEYINNLDNFISDINENYLNSPRKQLRLKLHQKMTYMKFISNLDSGEIKHVIAHKPRSGKTITMLYMCKHLLENGYNRILIMTSVKSTIENFKDSIQEYIDFKSLEYKIQDEDDLLCVEEDFQGIVLCSTQYLKTNTEVKQKFLDEIDFDVSFMDECHIGGSKNKTKKIVKNIRLNIFVSGTPGRVKNYYNIPSSCFYEWETEDESYMKNIINNEERDSMISFMENRHGSFFIDCLNDDTLNKDYSSCPSQVLIKFLISENLKNQIDDYNLSNPEKKNLGYSVSSLFNLKQRRNRTYREKFEICSTVAGENILKSFFENIISKDLNKNTLMRSIEEVQHKYDSRQSTIRDPLLFIIYLPINNRTTQIKPLQKAFKYFLEKHNLWTEYNIEYSNSTEDTVNSSSYNNFIKKIMDKTKRKEKKGCILLLGNKGSVGITYHKCDVTISLDNGHELDTQKQKFSRALTECQGKTIGINVDMNIQRVYYFLKDKIRRYRSITKSELSNSQILYYMYKHNIFLYNPDQFQNEVKKSIISSYYETEVSNLTEDVDITTILENIVCQDEFMGISSINIGKTRVVNPSLEGDQQDVEKPSTTKIETDIEKKRDDNTEEEKEKQSDEEKDEEAINNTKQICTVLLPLLALLSRIYKIYDFDEIINNENCNSLIRSVLYEKFKIDIKDFDLFRNKMSTIIDNNEDIINDIREIYNNASPSKIRDLIAIHFIPSEEEKKKNAEVSTPKKLVDEMLSKVPNNFWTTPKKVFEPCCGKGNFVLGVFDMFYKGLENTIEDKEERCRVIIEECIYYSDITTLNIFITTQLLRFHSGMYINENYDTYLELDYEYNSNIGNTLELDIDDKWGLDGFDLVVGNPPYQAVSENGVSKGGGNNLYTKFIYYADKNLNQNGYLLYINPPTYFSPGRSNNKNDMNLRKDVLDKYYYHYINLEECVKYFNVGSKFMYYLIQKNSNKNDNVEIVCKYNNKVYKTNLNQDLLKRDYLPYLLINQCLNILDKVKNNYNSKLNIFNSTVFDKRRPYVLKKLKKENNEDYKKRALENGYIYPMQATSVQVVYSSKKCKNQNDKKVLMSESGYLKPFYDNGILGVGGHCFACLVKDENEGNKIIELLNSKLYKFYIETNKWSGFHHKKVLQDLPNIINEIENINDQEIYEYFNLTEEEIKIIEESKEEFTEESKEEFTEESKEEDNLSSLTVSELRKIAKTYKLRGYSKLKKKELVAFILENKN